MIFGDQSHDHQNIGVFPRLHQLIWRRKLLVIVPTIIGAAAATLLFQTTSKRYVATAVVVLDVRKVTVAPLDMVISRLPQDNPAIKTEIDVLGSRSMAEAVIERQGIANFGPLLRPTDDLPDERYRQALVDHITSDLQVNNDGRSFTIYISYTATDPVFAARIANTYAEQYFAHQTAVKFNAIRTASEWLGKKVEELRRKLEVSERAVDMLAAKNLNELQREIAANRSLYESFLTRYKATIEQEDLAAPEAQLVSEARPPGRPSTPRLVPYLALGIFVGAACGLVMAFLREFFDDGISSLARLEARCGIAVLGVLPAARRQQIRLPFQLPHWISQLLRWSTHAKSKRNEKALSGGLDSALQKLRAVLRFSRSTRNADVVAITSPSQGEGKTFVSTELARALRAGGTSVLIIRADLHPQALANDFDINPTYSWSEILSRTIPIENFIRTDRVSGVDFISPTEGMSAALVETSAFERILTDLRKRYDRIIIDTPSISQSADTAVLGAAADVVILVVRWRETTHGAVLDALRQLALCSLPVGGIILNQYESGFGIREETSIPPPVSAGDGSIVGSTRLAAE